MNKDVEGKHILIMYGCVGGFKTWKYLQMLYGWEDGWLSNSYAYRCLWCMWVGGSIISKYLRLLTAGMVGWVGNI